MKKAIKVILILCALLAISGGGWFAYTRHFSSRPFSLSYWTPSIQQTSASAVVGEGMTILATPEQDGTGFNNDPVVGRPLKITVTPSLAEHRIVSLRFSAIRDYEILFRPEFRTRLLKVLDDFDALQKRVTEQKRLSYRQQLDSVPFLDTSGTRREIRVFLRSTPERLVERDGFKTEEGQVIFLYLELPFPLEDTTNFQHTELSIPESGVQHLRRALKKLTEDANRENEVA